MVHPNEADTNTRFGDIVPDGYTLLDFTIQAKALGPDGDVRLMTTRSGGITPWEALGMVEAHANDISAEMLTYDQKGE